MLGTRDRTLAGPGPPRQPQCAGPAGQLAYPVPPSMSVCLCLFSMQNVVPIGEGDSVDVPQDSESQLQEQEKRIEISCALATEASRRGRMLSGERGWASLCPARETSRPGVGEEAQCRCKGGRNREVQGQGDAPLGHGEHLLSTRYCARLREVQRGQSR